MPSLIIAPLVIAVLILILESYIIFKEKESDTMKGSNLIYMKTFVVILEMVDSCLQVVKYGMN